MTDNSTFEDASNRGELEQADAPSCNFGKQYSPLSTELQEGREKRPKCTHSSCLQCQILAFHSSNQGMQRHPRKVMHSSSRNFEYRGQRQNIISPTTSYLGQISGAHPWSSSHFKTLSPNCSVVGYTKYSHKSCLVNALQLRTCVEFISSYLISQYNVPYCPTNYSEVRTRAKKHTSQPAPWRP